MTKKTMAEIKTNNEFMQFPVADRTAKRNEWYKAFRRNYRLLLKEEKPKM